MIYYCNKCKQYTEHTEKPITMKAGDSGFTKTITYICSRCSFAPLFIDPTLIKEDNND